MTSGRIAQPEDPLWFAMRVTYRRERAVQDMLKKEYKIPSFIPMRYEYRVSGHRRIRELVPAIHNLIFVHAVPSSIQKAKTGIPYLQYMVFGKERTKIIVPEDQMRRFMAVAGTYDEQLLYFKPGEVNLSKGMRVRILGGCFEGQEGILVKVKGARARRVVVSIRGVFDLAMASLPPELVVPIPLAVVGK